MKKNSVRAPILIVEDDPVQSRLYQQAMPYYGFEVAKDRSEAVRKFQNNQPSLVLLDHVLRCGDCGLDLIPEFKRLAAHVPVIIISGTLALNQQIIALSGPSAAHYVIEKPVDLNRLEGTVKIALRECGMAEAVASLQSLERLEMVAHGDRERLYSERLFRQHSILNQLRSSKIRPNITRLAEEFHVDRRSIRRDIDDLIVRGQIPAQ
jgi:DNA-binding NtrC family response regulator